MSSTLQAPPVVVVDRDHDLPFKLPAAFAASCFIAALGTDIVYVRAPDMVWVTFSVWAITIGLLVAAVAVIAGFLDRIVHRRLGTLGPQWPYLLGFAVVVVIEIVNAFVHSRDAYQAVYPEGITLSAVAVVLLVVTMIVGDSYSRSRPRRVL